MKVQVRKSSETNKASFQLCITLDEPPKGDPNNTDKRIGFSCHEDPTDKDSPTYTIKAYPYEDGNNCKQFLKTMELFESIETGQNIKSNEDQVVLMKQLFKGSALTAFVNKLPSAAGARITDANLKKAKAAMAAAIFLNKAACNQKKAMKKLKKPIEMSFWTFANRMKKLKDYLPSFLMTNNIKPNAMPEDKFLKMLHNALPKAGYQDKMQEHDYDPTTDDLKYFIGWIEKRCEPFDKKEPRNPIDKTILKRNKRGCKHNNDQQPTKARGTDGDKHYCMLHGRGNHSTEKCEKLKEFSRQARKERKQKKEHYKNRNGNENENSQDFHLGEANLDESQLTQVIAKTVEKTCNKLFKGFKREFEQDNHMMTEDMAPGENEAYCLKLNKDGTSSSNEE